MDEKSLLNTDVNREKSPSKFNLKICIYISLANFTTMMAWSLYNSNVNVSLNKILGSPALVGFLMTIDNIIALLLSPLVSSKSDTTRSKYGRRMPFLMVFVPLSAFFFALIPFVDTHLVPFLIVLFLFNFSMAAFRPQTFALLPDFIPKEHRSKGNGIVNLFGGLGAVVAFGLGGFLLDKIYWLSWVLISIAMVISLLIMFRTVKEPDTQNWDLIDAETNEKISFISSVKWITKQKDKSGIIVLFVIFAAYSGYNAVESLWTTYAVEYLDLMRGEATFSLIFVGVCVILFSIPAGLIAQKIGRKTTIYIGLIIGAISVIICNYVTNLVVIQIFFAIFGFCWAMINVNTITIVWDLAPTPKHIGIYSALYYLAATSAAIFGPFGIGAILEFILGNKNYEGLFLVAAIFFVIAMILLAFVTSSSSQYTESEQKERETAILNASENVD